MGCNIIRQPGLHFSIRSTVIDGFANACKTAKARIVVIKQLMPLLCDTLVAEDPESEYVGSVVRVMVACGGSFDRSVFIPGQSRENEIVRELFIKSQCMKLLLFLKKKYP